MAPVDSVGFALSALGFAVSQRFREVLAPLDLEPREFALLRAVQDGEGQSQHALAVQLSIPPSRMVGFIDALERRGLLERRANPADRRARALFLTRAGRDLVGRGFATAVVLEADLCGDLEPGGREELLELLAHVGTRLGVEGGAHPALTSSV